MPRKFTLIELLVVIAIIGLLMSILLPSIADARRTAMRAICVSNSKQIATGTFIAMSSFDGKVSASGNCWGFQNSMLSAPKVGDRKVGWYGTFLVMSDIVSTTNRTDYTADVSDYAKMKPLLCPEDTVQTVTDELSIGSTPPDIIHSYAPNNNVFDLQQTNGVWLGCNPGLIGDTSNTMMFMCSEVISQWNARYMWANANKTLGQRYSDWSGGAWGELFPENRHVGNSMPVTLFDGSVRIRKVNASSLNDINLTKGF
ncbi:MAG: type II secretion system GspH family protein [Lentisphaerales bacterium]|nr:type II secretion system GspH family protein [Lentisphaerales bacterium]